MSAFPEAPGGRLDPQELRAWRGMLRAHAALTKKLDADLEARHGLPLTSYEVLVRLADAEDERMRMCDLASSIVLSRSGLTRLVDRLERDGLIVRQSCASDAGRLRPAHATRPRDAGGGAHDPPCRRPRALPGPPLGGRARAAGRRLGAPADLTGSD